MGPTLPAPGDSFFFPTLGKRQTSNISWWLEKFSFSSQFKCHASLALLHSGAGFSPSMLSYLHHFPIGPCHYVLFINPTLKQTGLFKILS